MSGYSDLTVIIISDTVLDFYAGVMVYVIGGHVVKLIWIDDSDATTCAVYAKNVEYGEIITDSIEGD